LVDLHLHTTASDGRLAPAGLVTLAAAAGLRTISVTDHDTTAGLAEARGAAEAAGVRLVSGIEITAVEEGRDVHVLGYFFDERSDGLRSFLETQRADRLRRVVEIGERLRSLGLAVPLDLLVARARRHPEGRVVAVIS
jgi:predicted metal-dependent phosphoesterase TrpH